MLESVHRHRAATGDTTLLGCALGGPHRGNGLAPWTVLFESSLTTPRPHEPIVTPWARRVPATLHTAPVWMISREDLIRNNRATARTQDQADAEFLESLPE